MTANDWILPWFMLVRIMSTRYVEKAAAKIESRSGLFSITSLCEPIATFSYNSLRI